MCSIYKRLYKDVACTSKKKSHAAMGGKTESKQNRLSPGEPWVAKQNHFIPPSKKRQGRQRGKRDACLCAARSCMLCGFGRHPARVKRIAKQNSRYANPLLVQLAHRALRLRSTFVRFRRLVHNGLTLQGDVDLAACIKDSAVPVTHGGERNVNRCMIYSKHMARET